MHPLLIVLSIIAIIATVFWVIDCTKQYETFKYPEREINAAILFAAYNLTEHDYKFIEHWNKDIPFYVVVNGAPTEWDEKVIKIIGSERYINRPNEGYDAYAWKEGLNRWKVQLSNYDLIGLMNNSCIYAVDMKKLFAHAIDYDMYGLYQDRSEFGVLAQGFLQSYCIIVNHKLFNSKDWTKYWNNLPKITNFRQAVNNHELKFTKHFYRLGYKIGTYHAPVEHEDVYAPVKRNSNNYYREFIKYKEIKKHPKSYNQFVKYINRMRKNGYQ